MCKILAMCNLTEDKDSLVKEFMARMAKAMTSGNNDGLGYAGINFKGERVSERWLKNDEAFKTREALTDLDRKIEKDFAPFLNAKEEGYGSEGNYKDPLAAVILHARAATSKKVFENTHPFMVDNVALIHNGVISNHEKFDKTVSSCDSEAILTQYMSENVMDYPEHIKDALKDIEGSYACAILTQGKDATTLDIFKNNSTNLTASFIKELNTLVFSTSAYDVENVCKEMNLTVVAQYGISPGYMLRMDVYTGTVIGVYKFDVKSYGYNNYNTSYNSHRSHSEYASCEWDEDTKSWVKFKK